MQVEASLLFAAIVALLLPKLGHSECIEFDGRERCWLEKVPDAASTAQDGSLPLLVDLHGLTGSNTGLETYGLGTLYNVESFFAALPQGVGVVGRDSSWNAGSFCCGAARKENVNDEGFLLQMIQTIISKNPQIDSRRVYISGHSNGCIMSNAMAIKHSDVIAAFGCFSGYATAATLLSAAAQNNYRPMHGIIAQGTDDEILSYGLVERYVEGSLKDLNECDAEPVTRDYGNNKVETYSCANGVEVALITLQGVGHKPYSSLDSTITTPQFVWDFISRGTLPSVDDEMPPPTATKSPTTMDSSSSSAPTKSPTTMDSSSAPTNTKSQIMSSSHLIVIWLLVVGVPYYFGCIF